MRIPLKQKQAAFTAALKIEFAQFDMIFILLPAWASDVTVRNQRLGIAVNES